jgi:hypothetical protein
MNEAALNVAPAGNVELAHHDDVDRHEQAGQDAAEPNRLLGGVLDVGLDHEKVQIAVAAAVTTGRWSRTG